MADRKKTQRASKISFAAAVTAVAVLLALIFILVLGQGEQADVSNTLSDVSSDISGNVSGDISYVVDMSRQDDENSNDASADVSGTQGEASEAPPSVYAISSDTLNSGYACLLDRSTGAVIAAKNADMRIAPASLTKIATAITVIEMCDDFDEMLTVTRKTVDDMYLEGASVVGFLANEQASVVDMLYGVMLPSGADAAVTLAERFGGTESGFAELINQKMADIGLADTHFVNVTGLDADGHYSTAADIARLLNYCLQNELFKIICTADHYVITSPTMHEGGIELYHTVFAGFRKAGMENKYCLGGKTGTTDNAGRCLAALCLVDGNEYITVTLGAGGTNGQGFVPHDLVTLIEDILPCCKQA